MIFKLLKKVATALESQQIEYMISGSVAMGFYTVARTTRDIDVVVELYEKNVDAFLSEFENFYHYKPSIIEEIHRQGMFNLIDHTSGFKVDFILRKHTEYAQEAFGRRQRLDDLGFPIWVISVEDLILAKLMWIQDYQSDRQIDDLKSLFQNPAIDWNYVRKWVKELNYKTFNILPNE